MSSYVVSQEQNKKIPKMAGEIEDSIPSQPIGSKFLGVK